MSWLDNFMGWLSDKLSWLPKLGFGYGWGFYVGEKRVVVMLWPFVALAIFIVALLIFDKVVYG